MKFNNLYIPFNSVNIEKSKKNGKNNKNYIVAGYASTFDKDMDAEQIDPNGIDITYLMKTGYIDYEHDREEIVGIPTSNTHVDDNGLYLEAELFGDNEHVQKMMNLYDKIASINPDRRLGFSIEGQVKERDFDNDDIIREVAITGVAITKTPCNPNARWDVLNKSLSNNKELDEVQKAWEAGDGITPATQDDGAAFRSSASFITEMIDVYSKQIKALRKMYGENIAPMTEVVAQKLKEKGIDNDPMVIETYLRLFSAITNPNMLEDISKLVASHQKLKKDADDTFDDGDDD